MTHDTVAAIRTFVKCLYQRAEEGIDETLCEAILHLLDDLERETSPNRTTITQVSQWDPETHSAGDVSITVTGDMYSGLNVTVKENSKQERGSGHE